MSVSRRYSGRLLQKRLIQGGAVDGNSKVDYTSTALPFMHEQLQQAKLNVAQFVAALKETDAIVAGSSPLKAILLSIPCKSNTATTTTNVGSDALSRGELPPGIWQSDLDVWVVENEAKYLDPVQVFDPILKAAGYIITGQKHNFDSEYKRLRKFVRRIYTYADARRALSPTIQKLPPIQIMVLVNSANRSALDTVNSFDLSICQVVFTGDNQLFALQPVQREMQLTEATQRQSPYEWVRTFRRIAKYVDRGFLVRWQRALELFAASAEKSFEFDGGRGPEKMLRLRQIHAQYLLDYEIWARRTRATKSVQRIREIMKDHELPWIVELGIYVLMPSRGRQAPERVYRGIDLDSKKSVLEKTDPKLFDLSLGLRWYDSTSPESTMNEVTLRGTEVVWSEIDGQQQREARTQARRPESPYRREESDITTGKFIFPSDWKSELTEHTRPLADQQQLQNATCFDFIMFMDQQTQTYLSEDEEDNIVILAPRIGAAGAADNTAAAATDAPLCYSRQTLRDSLLDETNVFYPCTKPTGFPVDTSVKFVKLTLPNFSIFVPESDIRSASVQSATKVFQAESTPLELARTASVDAVLNSNYVSADHCQAGSDKRIYRLRPVKFE